MYEREIDKNAIHWDSDQVAEYLQQRCLKNPPAPHETVLGDVWRDILEPFFANNRKHSPIKKRAVLLSELAEVDAIWAQVGALHFPISGACSAIAFVLSICLPPFPPDDWVSIAAVFVHFCRLAPRDSRPTTVRLLWRSQSHSASASVPSLSYPSPEHFQSRRRDGARAIILLDDVISGARATSTSPSSNLAPNSYDTYDPSYDVFNIASNSNANPKHKVFRPQKPEELLDTLGLRDVWPHWELPNSSPVVPQTPKNVYSDSYKSKHNTWPSTCRCSAIMPTIYVINEQKRVHGVAFAFKPFYTLLQQHKKGEVPHLALLDAVEPWCEACRFMLRRVGVRFEDLASSPIPPKEPLAFVSYTDVDVYRDLDLPENEPDLPTRPSSQATSPLNSLAKDLYPHLPHSSPHALPPSPPDMLPPRSAPGSLRVFPNQLPPDRDPATPSKAAVPLIQRSWVRSPAITISRGQTSSQQERTQQPKGDARFSALNSHMRPSPTPPMPRMQPESMGQGLGLPGEASERRQSPHSNSPMQAPAPHLSPRPSSTGPAQPLHLKTANTDYIRPSSASGYASPPLSPRSRARSLAQQQAPLLPEPSHSPSSSSFEPKQPQARPTVARPVTAHYPYAVASQPPASAPFNNPPDAPRITHAIPRTEAMFRATYQPADGSGGGAPNYYSRNGRQQHSPPITVSPTYRAAAAAAQYQQQQQPLPSSYPAYHHQAQPHPHAPSWPVPAGYPPGARPPRSSANPVSSPHLSSAQFQPRHYGHHHQPPQTLYQDEWDDYEVVSPPPLMQHQPQNYRSGPTSLHAREYQTYTPRAHHQHPPQSHYPSPPHLYSHTHPTRERDYNYNDDDGTYDEIVPVYL